MKLLFVEGRKEIDVGINLLQQFSDGTTVHSVGQDLMLDGIVILFRLLAQSSLLIY